MSITRSPNVVYHLFVKVFVYDMNAFVTGYNTIDLRVFNGDNPLVGGDVKFGLIMFTSWACHKYTSIVALG